MRGSVRTEQFALAKQGIAKPRGGHSDPLRHNLEGDTESIFTSWTTDPEIAKVYAGKGGVVLEAEIPNTRVVASPDRFGESEILVTGTVSGAKVLE